MKEMEKALTVLAQEALNQQAYAAARETVALRFGYAIAVERVG
jgi:hypothetical protein